MKNKKILIALCLVIYLGIISFACLYLVIPGVNKLNDANKVKELTYDEKTKLIDETNQKYINLENEVNNKYAPSITSINEKYDNSKVLIEEKYDNLEIEIEDKYKKEEKELTNKINDNKVMQKTILKEGFSLCGVIYIADGTPRLA